MRLSQIKKPFDHYRNILDPDRNCENLIAS